MSKRGRPGRRFTRRESERPVDMIELDTTRATRPPAPAGGICTRHLHRRRRAPPEFVGRHARCPFPIVSSCAPPSPSVSRGNNYTTTAASADDSKLTSSDS
jgi:hypothetical protein